ncbi:MAG: TolB family protein, partial [Myxococcales bacterium]
MSATRLVLISVLLLAPGAAFASATFHGVERQITRDAADQYDPAISGNLIVYTDNRGVDRDVYYFDLSSAQEVQVTAAHGAQELSDVHGSNIVYTDYTAGDVVLYEVDTGNTFNLTHQSPGQAVEPAIGERLVVWQDNRDGNWEIYARELGSGLERRVTTSGTPDMAPATSGLTVVWEQCPTSTSCDIAAWDWDSATVRMITSTPGDERRPDISGRLVTYEAVRDGERDVYVFDLATWTEKRLSMPGVQRNPNISGEYVAFEDLAGGASDILLWHVTTGSVFRVTV